MVRASSKIIGGRSNPPQADDADITGARVRADAHPHLTPYKLRMVAGGEEYLSRESCYGETILPEDNVAVISSDIANESVSPSHKANGKCKPSSPSGSSITYGMVRSVAINASDSPQSHLSWRFERVHHKNAYQNDSHSRPRT